MSLFDVKQSTRNNDGGHAIVASFLPLDSIDVSTWLGLIANPSTNAERVTLQAGDIMAKSGERWIQISTETEMIGSELGNEGSSGSLSIVGQPTIKFNNLTEEELGFIESVKNVPGIWVLKDIAGTQWLYGSPDLPAKLTEASGSFGTVIGDDKSLMFTIRSIEVPKVYSGSISYAAVV